MASTHYNVCYTAYKSNLEFVVQALSEEGGATINASVRSGGASGVQALLDVCIDNGHRAVLVKALNSPAISGWVREKMEAYLYGASRQYPALLRVVH